MRRTALFMATGLLSLALVSCASSPAQDSHLSQLRQEYQQLTAQESVRSNAASELIKADDALQAAENASGAEREQQLYLAERYLKMAQVVAQRKVLDKESLALVEQQQRQKQIQSELSALEAKKTSKGLLVTLKDVFFATDQATLQSGAENTLDKLADFMKEHSQQRMVVEGFTDSRGPSAYNQALSERRANAVKEAMVARGIDPSRITTQGYGERRPIASNDNAGGRQLNRRVEVLLPNTGS